MGRAPSSLATRLGLALAVAIAALSPPLGHTQDASVAPVDDPEPPPEPDDDAVRPVGGEADTALPPLSLSESALAAGTHDDDDDEEDDDAILSPTERPRTSDDELEAEEEAERATEEPDGEPTIIDDDMELPPDPVDLPDFRLRAGAGVALATAGDFPLGLRITEDFEWQPSGGEPFFIGVSGAQILFSTGIAGSVRLRLGLHAWFCEARPVRCQAGIAIVGGPSFGFGIVSPDIAGEVDLRFLFWDRLELHLRGGFSFLGPVPFIDITGGIGVAF